MTTILKRKRRGPKGPPSDPSKALAYWRNRFKSCYGVELAIKDPDTGATEQNRWGEADRKELNEKAAQLWPEDPFVDAEGKPITL